MAKTVSLSFVERLNLRGALGQTRVFDTGQIRHVWKLQDRLMLSDEERATIAYRTVVVDGTEREFWSRDASLPEVTVELSGREVLLVQICLRAFRYAGADRGWLERLLTEFIGEDEE